LKNENFLCIIVFEADFPTLSRVYAAYRKLENVENKKFSHSFDSLSLFL
jgi:hypothetical protein